MSRRVVVDCDTGVDDALALLYLAAEPGTEIIAAGSVHGNVGAELAAANTLRVLELAGLPDVPVAVGAARPLAQPLDTAESVHGHDGLGGIGHPEPRATVTVECGGTSRGATVVDRRPRAIRGGNVAVARQTRRQEAVDRLMTALTTPAG